MVERMAVGQVEDLIAQLDPLLWPWHSDPTFRLKKPLLHPTATAGGMSTAPGTRLIPLEECLERVAWWRAEVDGQTSSSRYSGMLALFRGHGARSASNRCPHRHRPHGHTICHTRKSQATTLTRPVRP
jgi:hypothetical protein